MGGHPWPPAPFKSKIVPVEVSLGCSDLPLLPSTGSAISVFAVVWVRRQPENRWHEHGRTEPVRHGSTPQFTRSFFFDYLDHNDNMRAADYDTCLRIELYQHSNASGTTDLASQKRCGYVDTTLRELHRTPIKRLEMPLRLSAPRVISHGSLHVRIADAPPTSQMQPFVEIDIAAANVLRVRGTGQFFATVYRYTTGGVFELIYRTELARPSASANSERAKAAHSLSFAAWKPTLHRCCFEDFDSRLLFEFWREDKLGVHTSVGRAETSLAELLDASEKPAPVEQVKSDVKGRSWRARVAVTSHASLVLSGGLTLSSDGPACSIAKDLRTVLEIHAELFASSPKTPIEEPNKFFGSEDNAASPKQLAEHGQEPLAEHGQEPLAQRRQQRKKKSKAVSASASREFGDDLRFLQELAQDQLVKKSDVKDIVGDGIRYLHERHRRNQKNAKRAGVKSGSSRGTVSAPSGQQKKLQLQLCGLGGFLEDEDGTDDTPRRLPTPTKTEASRRRDQRVRCGSAPCSTQEASRDGTRMASTLPTLGARAGGGVMPSPASKHQSEARRRAMAAAARAEQRHAARRQAAALQEQRRTEEKGDSHAWGKSLAERSSEVAAAVGASAAEAALHAAERANTRGRDDTCTDGGRPPLGRRVVNTALNWDPQDPRRFDARRPTSRKQHSRGSSRRDAHGVAVRAKKAHASRRRQDGDGESSGAFTGPARWRRQQQQKRVPTYAANDGEYDYVDDFE